MALSIEERVFLVEYVFQEGNRYTDLVQEQFADKFPDTPVPHRNAVRRVIKRFLETGSVLDAERRGNLASFIEDGHTATLNTLYFFFNNYTY
jgi:hypothetical protein